MQLETDREALLNLNLDLTPMRMSEIVLKTSRFEELRDFYQGVLGVAPFYEHRPENPTAIVPGRQERASEIRLCFIRTFLEHPYAQVLGIFEIPGTRPQPSGRPGFAPHAIPQRDDGRSVHPLRASEIDSGSFRIGRPTTVRERASTTAIPTATSARFRPTTSRRSRSIWRSSHPTPTGRTPRVSRSTPTHISRNIRTACRSRNSSRSTSRRCGV